MAYLTSDYLLVDACETSYGYACIACSTTGIRYLDLFDSEALLNVHIRERALHRVTKPAPYVESQIALMSQAKLAVSHNESLEELPLDLSGTPFQLQVWQVLRSIPRGHVRSYQEVARMLGAPDSARAVANACARNVVGLAIPCHRVIHSDGTLGGYRWGTRIKERLLQLEGTTSQMALVSGIEVR